MHKARELFLQKQIEKSKLIGKRYVQTTLDTFHSNSQEIIEEVPKSKSQRQRQLLDALISKLGIETQSDWYKITSTELAAQGSTNIYGFSQLWKAFQSAYPEFVWRPWYFAHVPPRYWESVSTQREFFNSLAEHYGFHHHQQLCSLKIHQVKEHGGGGFMRYYYHDSFKRAFDVIYPEFLWHPWFFSHSSWTKKSVQRDFLDWIADQLNVNTQEEWYSVVYEDIEDFGGNGLFFQYQDSLAITISEVYSEFSWYLWKFHHVPRGFWLQLENRRKYFDWLAGELGIESMDSWYSVLTHEVLSNHGGGLLRGYHFSLYKALKDVYPEHPWRPWLFKNIPSGVWKNERNVKEFMDHLAVKLDLTKQDNWSMVSMSDVAKHGGRGLLKELSWQQLVHSTQPDCNWKIELGFKSKLHISLTRALREIFATRAPATV